MKKVLVTLPNSRTTYCIDCSKSAIGRECLEKVCHEQGIQCETEYFGLVYNPRRTRSISDHTEPNSGAGAHLTETEATLSSTSCTAESTISPALRDSTGNHHPLYYLEMETPPRGRQWLNLRNPLGRCDGSFMDLALRVKFWVPVHLLLQESVRNLFYMEARQYLIENRMYAKDWANAITLAALLAQADGVHFDPDGLEEKRRRYKRKSSEPCNDETFSSHPFSVYDPYTFIRPSPKAKTAPISKELFLQSVQAEHSKYTHLKVVSAKYWLLSEFEKLDGFGEEKFVVPRVDDTSNQVEIIVGPEGVVYSKGDERIEIPFSAIQRASSKNRTFRLKYLNQANTDDELMLKMPPTLCTALYRTVTEKHDFYSCETVRTDVTTQFIRDFKGTFLSIFNEDTELGKKYVFDIQRTCREVHDHARRVLHRNNGIPCGTEIEAGLGLEAVLAEKESQLERSEQIQEHISKHIAEVLTCKICMDNHINAAFACGHVISCMQCASKCDKCPMCRAEVTSIFKLYLPTELQQWNKDPAK